MSPGPFTRARTPHAWLRWVLRGLTIGLAGFLGYVLIQQGQTRDPLQVMPAPVFETTDADIEGFVYRQTEEGQVQWEVKAQKAEVYESEQHLLLKQVHVRLLSMDGLMQETKLEAEEGTINTANGNFDLRNQEELITVELANGYTIFTPHIHWVDEEQTISTNKPVTIHGHGLTITGVGLLAEVKAEKLEVLHDVRVQIVSST